MQEDAKQNCKECDGEGEITLYYANHKGKEVGWDWLYCPLCFPFSSGYTYFVELMDSNWVEIDGEEFGRLEKAGYKNREF